VAGGGGILINPKGTIEASYSWGLGRRSNNQAEIYGILQGLIIAKDRVVGDIIILGYPMITIQYIIKGNRPKENHLSRSLQRIRTLMENFHSRNFFHIIRSNNMEVDMMENLACSLE